MAAHPSLERISVIGHSLGGLLARCAIGALFNPTTRTICGLQPCHFITMATPHMGCDAEGISQVPFIGWTEALPLFGSSVSSLLQRLSIPVATLTLGRTGTQFFLADAPSPPAGAVNPLSPAPAATSPATTADAAPTAPTAPTADAAAEPLLVQMTQDVPSKGLHFHSALAAFATRTCYANCDGDHLVGWANSCLRASEELPELPAESSSARGVVLEQQIEEAFTASVWERISSRRAGAAQAAAAGAGAGAAAGDGVGGKSEAGAAGQEEANAEEALGRHLADSRGWHSISGSGAAAVQPAPVPAEASPVGNSTEPQLGTADLSALVQTSLQQAEQEVQEDAAAGRGGSTTQDEPSAAAVTASAAAAAAEDDLAAGLSRSSSFSSTEHDRNLSQPGHDAVAQHVQHVQHHQRSLRAQRVAGMLRQLQQLPWRRVDVCFKGATWGFAHNNIQVTRRLLNFQGSAVPAHLAQQLADMEALRRLAELAEGEGGRQEREHRGEQQQKQLGAV